MHDESLMFLKALLDTPSPSGFERPIQDVVRKWAEPLADELDTDRHGNVFAVRNPNGSPRIMLAGHCDQIGLMVQHIDDKGYLYVQPIGGWDIQILLGQHLNVWTRNGSVRGVLSRKAPHLLTPEERKKVPEFSDVWVDIGAKDGKQAERLVAMGDPITIEFGFRELQNGLVASPALDDKVGVWVVMEALRLLNDRNPTAAVYCVSTVQEEVGLRGAATSAYRVHPDVGIAVDVCHATDTPGNDQRKVGDIKIGDGPVVFRGPNINPRVFERLQSLAESNDLAIQPRGAPRATGTDANAIQLARGGVAAALVGIPNRYMHSPVETVSLEDLERAAQLLAEFCATASADDDWTP